MTTTEVKQQIHEFDARIAELLKDNNHVIQEGNERQLQDWDDYTEDNDENFAVTFLAKSFRTQRETTSSAYPTPPPRHWLPSTAVQILSLITVTTKVPGEGVLLSPGNPEGHCTNVMQRVNMTESRATQKTSL